MLGFGEVPVLSYRFVIKFIGTTGFGTLRAQSVNGLGFTLNLTDFKTTGGPKAMPSDVKYENLIIKRAVFELPELMEMGTQLLLNTLRVNSDVYLSIKRQGKLYTIMARNGCLYDKMEHFRF